MVGKNQLVVLIDHRQQHRRIVSEDSQALLPLPQRRLGNLTLGDVVERADDPQRPSIAIDDEATPGCPSLARGRMAHAALAGELPPLAGDARLQIGADLLAVFGDHPLEQRIGRSPEFTLVETEDLVQARRVIGATGDHVPVPQTVVGAARRQGVALLADAQLLVHARALDGAGDERRRGLQDVDLEGGPDALGLAVVETEEPPAAGAQHDRHGDERQGALLEEDLAVVSGQFAQGRLHDLAALAPLHPVVEAALIIDQRHVLIARVGAQRAQPRRGPVIAAALDRTVVGRAMDLEQRHPIDPGGDPRVG